MAANDSDVKSILSISSKSEGSGGALPRMRWRNAPLHERCSMNDMENIKEAFQAAYRNKMLPLEFRNLLRTLMNVEYDDEEFNILFMKINTARNGEIDWDELVSHLLLGYFGNDPENQRASLQLPIMGLPIVMRSQHRHPISRICFCPDVAKDRSTDPMQGNYMTVSRDGMINWWSLDMSLLRTAHSSSPHLKVRTTWVTDMVCMPDVNIIVTSSTERDLRFYDCTAKTFTLKIVITSWEYMICSMYYHFYKDINEQSILIVGDVGGYVRILTFSPVKRGPFRNQPGRTLLQLRHVDLQRRICVTVTFKVAVTRHRGDSETANSSSATNSASEAEIADEGFKTICVTVTFKVAVTRHRGDSETANSSSATNSASEAEIADEGFKTPHLLPEMKLIEKGRVHGEWVRQVSFYESLHCIVSCATCPDSLLMCDLAGSKTYNMFHVEKGIQCFTFDEEAHILATGGPDCTVRVWSPFVPRAASASLAGHRAAITALVLQHTPALLLYSLGRDRVIKVWDMQGQVCLQTYIDIPPQVGERTPISALYNPVTREFILGAIKIAIVVLDERLNPQHTDGFTHSRAVSKVLYNPLFKVVITCGLDSIIINWDPLTGKRNAMVRDAHTRLLHGELIPVEITAACFDPGHQLLLTGARNGTLKVWNFNTGICLRSMAIEHMCEVTNCFWVEGRILAVGWNRHVTEFEDAGGAGGSGGTGKAWETRHSDDVLAAAARPPLTLATATYNSELILWKLETGQPYRRFSCTEPMLHIKMQYSKRTTSPQGASATSTRRSTSTIRPSGKRESVIDSAVAMQKARARRVSTVTLPLRAQGMRKLAVHSAIFLNTRPCHMRVASLMVALENGRVQCWSDHPAGGLQGSFQGIHTAGDYVSAFATDMDNDYLFTGTTVGYIKIWLMTNYLRNEEVHVNMPRLRLTFPFLWRDRVEGRAKRSVRDQPLPMLLSSARAHRRCVTALAYVDDLRLLLSGSSDYSVRVWKLSGEYLQTLGGFLPWSLDVTRFPPDVKKVASSTTFKVWRGGFVSRYTPGQVPVDTLRDITALELRKRTFGEPAAEPLLGRHLALPRKPEAPPPPMLDDSLPTIPLYAHLRMSSTQPVRRLATPPLCAATRLRHASTRAPRTHFQPDRRKD